MAAGLDELVSQQSFIQATEVWVPDADGVRLVPGGGFYGAHRGFAGLSAGQGFGKGEGLPGRAWAEGRPVLVADMAGAGFPRSEAAERAGLTVAAAVPVFCGSALRGVLVLLCGEDEERAGAVEIWRGEGDAMTLDAGFYGAAEAFAAVSRETRFQRGQGLPGGVWGAEAPMLMRDLGGASGFVRSAAAKAAGLTTGLGAPIPTPSGAPYVLALLSARATPIARRFELWDVAPGKGGRPSVATLTDGLCETEGPLWGKERRLQPWQGAVGRAMASGAPVAEPAPAGARHAGIVALPIHHHAEVTHVVAWFI